MGGFSHPDHGPRDEGGGRVDGDGGVDSHPSRIVKRRELLISITAILCKKVFVCGECLEGTDQLVGVRE